MDSNCLIDIDSFTWPDVNIDRSVCLDGLLEIFPEIKSKSNIYSHPNCYQLNLAWGYFHDFVWEQDYSALKRKANWMNKDRQKLLQKLWSYGTSPRPSCNLADLEIEFAGDFNFLFGCVLQNAAQGLVYNTETYFKLEVKYYQTHQDEIDWDDISDDFLPNKVMTDPLLWKEVIAHKKEDELNSNKNKGSKTLTFHNEVMDGKGNYERKAYIKEFGGMLLELNYYEFDETLSNNEAEASGADRAIYKLVNRHGKIQYISLDHFHGMFEYHDEKGIHLGEWKYDGTFNSKADPSHNLQTI